MRSYFLGIAMRSYAHDYGQLHSLLAEVDARRASKRIWLITVKRDEDDTFRRIGLSLARGDELLIVEAAGNHCWTGAGASRPRALTRAEEARAR